MSGSSRGLRGGSWYLLQSSGFGSYVDPTDEDNIVGFRVATVPEPSTYALLLMTVAGALWMTRRRR